MKRLGIPICSLFLVLAGACFAMDQFSVVAQAPAKAVTAENAAVVPLFDSDTKLEPATIIDTPEAIITRVADRSRDRHAREWMFHVYDHYLPLYWEYRTVSIEIVDRVAKGGDTVTYNMTSLWPLNGPNLRAFFEGKGTVAQYAFNMGSKRVDPHHYTVTLKHNPIEKRALKIGDRIEIEFSPFLAGPPRGRTNYYGTALLYVVGQGGMQPWEWHEEISVAQKQRGLSLDSFPLPEKARLGGGTTVHQQYSDEPKRHYQQLATNSAPISAQPFMLGRRLHHTDFGTGVHSEPGNPVFTEQVGKLGSHFTNRSCVACHVNNGRALPAEVGKPLVQYLVRIGSDASGSSHPKLGYTLQQQAGKGAPEGTATLSGWTMTDGKFGDGTAYSLRKPSYKFSGVEPAFFSIRIAPPLVGLGLLEALDESTVVAFANAKNGDGIAGHIRTVTDLENGKERLGRFGWKAGQARVKHQIASALNNDMGITTSIYPTLDRGSEQPDPGPTTNLSDTDLDNMYRYMAVLGVSPRRDYANEQVVKGEALFATAGCAKCHTPTMKTGSFHPLAELRNQTIQPYTDMLLHDLGKGLADNMGEGNASASDWRTTPLWSIGLSARVSGGESYLHDGRARNLSEAILWHGGEAEASKEAFRTMPAADRAAVIRFLQSL